MDKKTKLMEKMDSEGWIQYTLIENAGLFGMDSHDKDLVAVLQANNIPFRVEHDSELQSDGMNSLYVKKSDYEVVVNLFTKPKR
jgi:hypothetical protein